MNGQNVSTRIIERRVCQKDGAAGLSRPFSSAWEHSEDVDICGHGVQDVQDAQGVEGVVGTQGPEKALSQGPVAIV